MHSSLLDEIGQALSEPFDKDKKSLYVRLHLRAFPLNEVDDGCVRCAHKAYNRLKWYYEKEKNPTEAGV